MQRATHLGYQALCGLFVAGALLQFFLAGLGVFGHGRRGSGRRSYRTATYWRRSHRKVNQLRLRQRSAGREALVAKRTNSWNNAHKKLVWCTEREKPLIDF